MDYYSAMRRDETPPFVTTWVDLENIVLAKTVKSRMISLMWDTKLKATKEQTRRIGEQKRRWLNRWRWKII